MNWSIISSETKFINLLFVICQPWWNITKKVRITSYWFVPMSTRDSLLLLRFLPFSPPPPPPVIAAYCSSCSSSCSSSASSSDPELICSNKSYFPGNRRLYIIWESLVNIVSFKSKTTPAFFSDVIRDKMWYRGHFCVWSNSQKLQTVTATLCFACICKCSVNDCSAFYSYFVTLSQVLSFVLHLETCLYFEILQGWRSHWTLSTVPLALFFSWVPVLTEGDVTHLSNAVLAVFWEFAELQERMLAVI